MRPEEVTKEVAASGILGHGGAAFPAGRKWGVIQPQRRAAALPLRQRRRRRAGHVQGPLDPRARAAPADRIDADRGLRAAGAPCLHLHPRRVRPAVAAHRRRRSRKPTPPAGSARASPAATSRCDLVVYRGAGSYVCGEASGLLTSLEGKQGLSAQPAAAPHGARPLPAADRHQQRRDAGQHHRHRPRRRRRPSARSARRRARARS